MKKYALLIFSLFMCSCFVGCHESQSTLESSVSDTDYTSVITTTQATLSSEVFITSEDITDNHDTHKEYYNKFLNGYLYDFDFDGTPELITESYFIIRKFQIYKIIDNSPKFIGTIPKDIPMFEQLIQPDLELYYDKLNDEYFYISEHDFWDKEYNYAEVNKYVFKNNELIVTNIARCKMEYVGTQDEINIISNIFLGKDTTPMGIVNVNKITRYYDGVGEYLSSFKKIKTISIQDELLANDIRADVNSAQ